MPNSTEEGGGSSGGNHSGSGSRKEKKKQAKEERDRLKQAEKKKRRLEKALATAAAIRSELEKKKQRRKEEEQRLDEEGAALAEAVALQVLVDEESDGQGSGKVEQEEMYSLESNESVVGETTTQRRQSGVFNTTGHRISGSSTSTETVRRASGEKGWNLCEWESPMLTLGTQNEEEFVSKKGLITTAEEKARVSTERARAAEMAAGLAAAQAVAALRIAEEARAEAEAAKKAAEAAMIEALDQRDPQQKRDQEMTVIQEPEEDKAELKARLIETEKKLLEKTRRVSELEQNLDEVTQYLLEFKAKFESDKNAAAVRLSGSSDGITSQRCSNKVFVSQGQVHIRLDMATKAAILLTLPHRLATMAMDFLGSLGTMEHKQRVIEKAIEILRNQKERAVIELLTDKITR